MYKKSKQNIKKLILGASGILASSAIPLVALSASTSVTTSENVSDHYPNPYIVNVENQIVKRIEFKREYGTIDRYDDNTINEYNGESQFIIFDLDKTQLTNHFDQFTSINIKFALSKANRNTENEEFDGRLTYTKEDVDSNTIRVKVDITNNYRKQNSEKLNVIKHELGADFKITEISIFAGGAGIKNVFESHEGISLPIYKLNSQMYNLIKKLGLDVDAWTESEDISSDFSHLDVFTFENKLREKIKESIPKRDFYPDLDIHWNQRYLETENEGLKSISNFMTKYGNTFLYTTNNPDVIESLKSLFDKYDSIIAAYNNSFTELDKIKEEWPVLMQEFTTLRENTQNLVNENSVVPNTLRFGFDYRNNVTNWNADNHWAVHISIWGEDPDNDLYTSNKELKELIQKLNYFKDNFNRLYNMLKPVYDSINGDSYKQDIYDRIKPDFQSVLFNDNTLVIEGDNVTSSDSEFSNALTNNETKINLIRQKFKLLDEIDANSSKLQESQVLELKGDVKYNENTPTTNDADFAPTTREKLARYIRENNPASESYAYTNVAITQTLDEANLNDETLSDLSYEIELDSNSQSEPESNKTHIGIKLRKNGANDDANDILVASTYTYDNQNHKFKIKLSLNDLITKGLLEDNDYKIVAITNPVQESEIQSANYDEPSGENTALLAYRKSEEYKQFARLFAKTSNKTALTSNLESLNSNLHNYTTNVGDINEFLRDYEVNFTTNDLESKSNNVFAENNKLKYATVLTATSKLNALIYSYNEYNKKLTNATSLINSRIEKYNSLQTVASDLASKFQAFYDNKANDNEAYSHMKSFADNYKNRLLPTLPLKNASKDALKSVEKELLVAQKYYNDFKQINDALNSIKSTLDQNQDLKTKAQGLYDELLPVATNLKLTTDDVVFDGDTINYTIKESYTNKFNTIKENVELLSNKVGLINTIIEESKLTPEQKEELINDVKVISSNSASSEEFGKEVKEKMNQMLSSSNSDGGVSNDSTANEAEPGSSAQPNPQPSNPDATNVDKEPSTNDEATDKKENEPNTNPSTEPSTSNTEPSTPDAQPSQPSNDKEPESTISPEKPQPEKTKDDNKPSSVDEDFGEEPEEQPGDIYDTLTPSQPYKIGYNGLTLLYGFLALTGIGLIVAGAILLTAKLKSKNKKK